MYDEYIDDEVKVSRMYTNLEKAITDENCIVRLFQSGGGLCVVISKSKLTVKATIKQIYGVFSMKGFNWINSVIIKKNNSIEIIKR